MRLLPAPVRKSNGDYMRLLLSTYDPGFDLKNLAFRRFRSAKIYFTLERQHQSQGVPLIGIRLANGDADHAHSWSIEVDGWRLLDDLSERLILTDAQLDWIELFLNKKDFMGAAIDVHHWL